MPLKTLCLASSVTNFGLHLWSAKTVERWFAGFVTPTWTETLAHSAGKPLLSREAALARESAMVAPVPSARRKSAQSLTARNTTSAATFATKGSTTLTWSVTRLTFAQIGSFRPWTRTSLTCLSSLCGQLFSTISSSIQTCWKRTVTALCRLSSSSSSQQQQQQQQQPTVESSESASSESSSEEEPSDPEDTDYQP